MRYGYFDDERREYVIERPDVPVIGLISRLYDQKGLDLIANLIWGLMRLDLQQG